MDMVKTWLKRAAYTLLAIIAIAVIMAGGLVFLAIVAIVSAGLVVAFIAYLIKEWFEYVMSSK